MHVPVAHRNNDKAKKTYAEAIKFPFDEKQQKFTVPSCPFRVSFCFRTTAGKKVNQFT